MKRLQRGQRTSAALVWLLMAGVLWPADGGSPAEAALTLNLQGAALWSGDLPLTARIAGHDHALPPRAARCINCHGGATGGDPLAGTAPQLTARYLREPVARRGGPPSRYDAATFCTLLRTGVDPTSVLLPRHMPRYTISDAECAALWNHLGWRSA